MHILSISNLSLTASWPANRQHTAHNAQHTQRKSHVHYTSATPRYIPWLFDENVLGGAPCGICGVLYCPWLYSVGPLYCVSRVCGAGEVGNVDGSFGS